MICQNEAVLGFLLQSWTFGKNAKPGQKVLFREYAKSAYFRSSITESDHKLNFVKGLGTVLRNYWHNQGDTFLSP